MGDCDAARPAAGPRAPRPRRLQADQRHPRSRRRRPAPAPRARPWRRRTCAARTGRSASAATSSRSSCRGPRRSGAHVVVRRLLAACLEGEGEGSERMAVSFSAGISAIPGLARDRDSLYGQAEAALLWGKRHGRTCVTIYDAGTARPADRPSARRRSCRPWSPGSPRPARCGRSSSRSTTWPPARRAGYEGLVRPLPDSGFTDAGSMFEAAEATGRTGELDLACLNTVMETAARLRLPGNLTDQPVAADDGDGRLQRPRPAPADRPPRAGPAPGRPRADRARGGRGHRTGCGARSRRAGSPASASPPTTSGAGNAGLRLLSQLRFDIVKIDLSLVQGGALHDASLEVVRTLRDLADRWGALVVAEGIETPAQLDVVRSLGIGAGQGYLLGRPTRPPVDRAARPRGTRPEHGMARSSGCGRCRHDRRATTPDHRVAVDASTIPARLRPRRRIAVGVLRGDRIGLVRFRGSPQGRRRRDVGWPPRASCRSIPPTYPSSTFFSRFRGLVAFLGLLPAPGGTEGHGGTSAASATIHRSPSGPSPGRRGSFVFPA